MSKHTITERDVAEIGFWLSIITFIAAAVAALRGDEIARRLGWLP